MYFQKNEINAYAQGISPNNVLRVFTPDNFIRHYQTISGGSLDKLGLTTKDVARILSGIPSLGEVYNGNFLIVEGRDGYIYAAPSDDPYLLSRADKNPTREEAERKLREATKGKPRDVQKPPAGNGGGGNPGTGKPKNRLDGGDNRRRPI